MLVLGRVPLVRFNPIGSGKKYLCNCSKYTTCVASRWGILNKLLVKLFIHQKHHTTLRILGMSSCHLFGGPFRGVTFGGSDVAIGGVRSLRVMGFPTPSARHVKMVVCLFTEDMSLRQ